MTTILVILIFIASAVGFAIGYHANPQKVQAFVKAHVIDDAPEAHEDHAGTRYDPRGDDPSVEVMANTARKAIEADGMCGDCACQDCPMYYAFKPYQSHIELMGLDDDINNKDYNTAKVKWFRAWLASHGLEA